MIGPIAPILLQQTLAQVSNYEDLLERLLPRLTSSQQVEFQQQVNLFLTQSDKALEKSEKLTDGHQILHPEFIRKCEQILIEIIGPIAPIILQQALSLENQNPTKLVETLAMNIPDTQLRLKFQQRVLMED